MNKRTVIAATAAALAVTMSTAGAAQAHGVVGKHVLLASAPSASVPFQKTLYKQKFAAKNSKKVNTLAIVRTYDGALQAIVTAPTGTGKEYLSAVKMSYYCDTSPWLVKDLRGTAKWNQNMKGKVRNRLVLNIPKVKPGCTVTASVSRDAWLGNPRGNWVDAKKIHVSQAGKVTVRR